jgi:hypothetical protein
MTRALINEWRVLRREPGMWLLCGAYVLLLVYGCAQSIVRVRDQRVQAAAALDDYARRWAGLRAAAAGPATVWGDWRSASLVGGGTGASLTWMPVDGLAVLSPGESLRQPLIRRIALYRADEEPPLENPMAPAGGLFDLSFVVQWLLPLTIAVAAHGAISVDRQRGTWRLIAATTSTPGRVLAARLLWPTAVLAGITIAAGTVAVVLAGPVSGVSGGLRLLAWWGLVGAYATLWALAVGSVSARAPGAAASLTTAGLLWITLTWVAPGVLDAIVTAATPPPNRVDAHVAAREIDRDLEQRRPAMLEAIYARHPGWRPSPEMVAAAMRPVPGGPASRDSRRVYVPAMAAAEAIAPFVRAAAERRARTEAIVRRWSVVSPALAVQLVADQVAGMSAERFVAFERRAADAERAWHAFFAPRIMGLQDMTRADMDHVPPPTPFLAQPPIAAVLPPVAGLLAAMIVGAVVLRRSLPHLKG